MGEFFNGVFINFVAPVHRICDHSEFARFLSMNISVTYQKLQDYQNRTQRYDLQYFIHKMLKRELNSGQANPVLRKDKGSEESQWSPPGVDFPAGNRLISATGVKLFNHTT